MPKRTGKSFGAPSRVTLTLAVTAVAVFLVGQGLLLVRSDSGRLLAARYLGVGDRAHITRLLGKQIRRGLSAVGVPADSLRETVVDGEPAVHWRVGLREGASTLQVNYAITKCVTDRGAAVLSGRERQGKQGERLTTLVVGFPGRPTHEVVLVRPPPRPAEAAPGGSRLALILYGFDGDPDAARTFFPLPLPFSVAIAPGADWSPALFRMARENEREVILYLPLEPINYPQVSPGPGTILVTMKPAKITGLLRRYLDQAGPVAAVANKMGSLATQDMSVMGAIYQELKRQQVPFLHISPAAGAVCKPLAADLGVAYEQPDRVVDSPTRAKTPRSLEETWNHVLSETAERGQMVVMLRATPLTLEWLPGALGSKRLKGVSLVPLSSVLKKPMAL